MTTKTIYFGAYSADDLADMDIDAFEHNGTFYEFQLDIHLEDGFIRINDTVGRMIPLDMTHYQDLAQAMEMVQALQALQNRRNEMVQALQALQNRRNEIDEVLNNGRTALGLQFDSEMDEFVIS